MDIEKQNEVIILQETHKLRMELVETLRKDALGGDLKALNVIGKLLSDVDKQQLGKLRVRVEEEGNANAKQATDLIAEIFNTHNMHTLGQVTENNEHITPPDIANAVPDVQILEGEMSTTLSIEDSASFKKRVT